MSMRAGVRSLESPLPNSAAADPARESRLRESGQSPMCEIVEQKRRLAWWQRLFGTTEFGSRGDVPSQGRHALSTLAKASGLAARLLSDSQCAFHTTRRRAARSFGRRSLGAEGLEDRLLLAAAVTWRAGLSPADNFVLNADGNSGAELSLSALGNVSVAPAGVTLFNLDTAGNLTLAGALTTGSSRTLKENITPVSGWQTLQQLASLPLWQWNYIADPAGVRHLGPTAEDFYAAFGLGADAQHLAPTDLAGVLLPGVQALSQIADRQEAQIATLLIRLNAIGPSDLDGVVSVRYAAPAPQASGVSSGAGVAVTNAGGIRFLGLDQVINDDFIVQGNMAIGVDAVDGENFGTDTLRLKAGDLRIHFEDTSSTANFPANDWRIVINDTGIGGTNHFSVEDSTAATTPFRINAGAPTSSLVIGPTGNVGLGTATPAQTLHLAANSSPVIRLQQDNSGAMTPQTWDVGGTNASFFIRDVTSGLTPFEIRPGAPTSSIDIASNGNVGIGTNGATPQQALQVSGSAGNTQLRIEEATTTSGQRNLVDLRNNGPVLAALQNSATGNTWQFGIGASNSFVVGVPGAPNPVLRIGTNGSVAMGAVPTSFALDTNGNLTIAGTLSAPSSRALKENFGAVDGSQILNELRQLPAYRWNYITDGSAIQHVGPLAEDFFASFGLGADAKHLAPGDVAGVALAAIQSLSARLQYQGRIIQYLTSAIDGGSAGSSLASVSNRSGVRFRELDQVIADDLIVAGSLGIGSVVNGETFDFDTMRLKGEVLRINFDDTSATGGFASNDWRILINDAGGGSANHFTIEDSTGAATPFRINAGAPTSALVVGSSGVGLGTLNPALNLHLVSGSSPTLRLQQTGIAQTWDVGGNDTNFFVSDITGGSRLPFRIRPNAPTSSLDIASNGNVGIGTGSAVRPLQVVRSDGSAQVLVQESSAAVAARDLLALHNNGGPGMTFTNTAGTPVTWRSGVTNTGAFSFDLGSTAGNEFTINSQGVWTIGPNGTSRFALDASGNLTIAGTLSQGSSRAIKENFAAVDVYDTLRRLGTLPVLSWNYIADADSVRHIGPMAEDFYAAFGLGEDAQHLAPSDLAAVNLAGLQALLGIARDQGAQMERLSARLGVSWTSSVPAGLRTAGSNTGPVASNNAGHSNNTTATTVAASGHEDHANGLFVYDDTGRVIGDVTGTWQDQDPSTPNVVDIWYDFRSEQGVANQITAPQIAVARQALAGWEAVSGGLLRFTQNTTAPATQIINIGVGDLRAFGLNSSPRGILGISGGTLSADGSRTISEGAAWLDIAENWDVETGNGNPAGTIDFFSVVAHELGHALGVGHIHNPNATDILSTYYRGEIQTFSADDRALIRSLYLGLRLGGIANTGGVVHALDQVVADDVIVQGNAAIGFDAANDEVFGTDTLRIKENNLRIHFEDTSTTPGAASNAWRIVINDTTNDGASYFLIEDSTAATSPFRINAGAPTAALVIGSSGNVGLGIDTPLQRLHIRSGSTPGIRLEQDNSGAFTPQTWDLAGNDVNFFIRDVTNGGLLPFRIRSGAPGSSMVIAANGNVGLGTNAPASTLHVHRADGTSQLLVEEDSATNATRTLLLLINNGAPSIAFTGLFEAVVNISLSTSSGSEQSQTQVTITATATVPVVGSQTVQVLVSGPNITSGDYTLGNATITIPDGATFGQTTLTIVADGLLEAAMETATISLANPSSGLTLGGTISATLKISDYTLPALNPIAAYTTNQPTISWQPVSGAVRYEVWFSRIFPSAARIHLDSNVTVTSWSPPVALAAGQFRYWVRAFDAAGNVSLWSIPNTFQVRPTLIAPLSGTSIDPPTFQWVAIPFASSYQLFLRTTAGDQIISNIVGTSYKPPTVLPAGMVSWWIRATGSPGNGGWSFAGKVTIAQAVVTGPASPANSMPTITWNAVSGAGRYVLYVRQLSSGNTVINQDQLTVTQYIPPAPLAAGGYRAWVKAIDAVSNSFSTALWSLQFDFTVATNDAEGFGNPLNSVAVTGAMQLPLPLLLDFDTAAKSRQTAAQQRSRTEQVWQDDDDTAEPVDTATTPASSGSVIPSPPSGAGKALAREVDTAHPLEIKILDQVMGQSLLLLALLE